MPDNDDLVIESDWDACKELAREPSILKKVLTTLIASGLQSEQRNACITYLTVFSCLLDDPVCLIVKGLSSGGKSHLVKQVVKLFPDYAFYSLSGMSEHALVYDTEKISHRCVIVYEAEGLHGQAVLFMRTLISENEIKYTTVIKTRGGLEALAIHREGPIGFITTSTKDLHPENENRCLVITVDDSPEQTAKILGSRFDKSTASIDLTQWHALYNAVESGNKKVSIPFGRLLGQNIQPIAVRLRRDAGHIDTLIRTHALIHQNTRDRDSQGRIIATIEQDYAIVYGLIDRALSENIDASVPKIVRETVNVVERLGKTTVQAIANELNLHRTTVLRRVYKAVKSGYLTKLQAHHRDRDFELVIGDAMPTDIHVLPDPKALAELYKKEGGS